jgi:sialic acid synthase SpsE
VTSGPLPARVSMHTYIIGEVGQNHNGSVDLAKLLIEMLARPVVEDDFRLDLPRLDAVKFTKRDLAHELSRSEMARPYASPHSFGATYGEHRARLELSDEQHFELYRYAKSFGFDFVETLCAIGCLSMLDHFTPDKLKVASRDLTNLPLLAALADTRIPIILSTGMADRADLDAALEVITKRHEQITILHCVSEYPTHPDNTNLLTVRYLQKEFPGYEIGYSDHTIGISAPVAAVALGARVIEKHVTLDRRMKGTDQAGSLGPDGVSRMVRDIRLMERSMGQESLFIEPAVAAAKIKLERSVAAKVDIEEGAVVREEDLHLLSPGSGLRWSQRGLVVGGRALRRLLAGELVQAEDVSAVAPAGGR